MSDMASLRQPSSMSVRLVELGQLRTEQEAVGGSENTGLIIAGNLPRRVHAERKDEGDAWETEGCEGAVETSYETVGDAARVNVEAGDRSRSIDSIGNGSGRVFQRERSDGAVSRAQEGLRTVKRAVLSRNLARGINARGLSILPGLNEESGKGAV